MSLADPINNYFDREYANHSTTIFRDLLMNFKKIMEESPLEENDRLLSLLAVASSLQHSSLETFAIEQLQERGLTPEQIQEAKESAAIMGMLNTYYKFKSFVDPQSLDSYARAGLRMQALMKPQNGKEKFEMMAFAVSVVNGCPSCVFSHEKALRQLNVDPEKIHDLARLAAVVKGLAVLKH
jgi:alkyl hydroperoxide reductase subunit D